MSQISTKIGHNQSVIYDEDFYQWTIEQSQALGDRQVQLLDWDNLRRDLLIDYPELKNKLPQKSPYSLDEWLK